MSDDTQKPRQSFSPGRKWTVGFDVVLRTLVVLAVLVMANYLSGKIFIRHSLSDQTRMELYPRTLNLLRTLTNEVAVTIYYDREDPLYTHIDALLREYRAANPKIRVRTVDYLRDAAEAQKVKTTYKLADAANENDKNLVIFDCDGRLKVIPGNALADRSYVHLSSTNSSEPQYELKTIASRGEMLFSGAILTVTNPRQLKAYALQGRGEHNMNGSDDVSGYLTFKSVLGQNSIQLDPLFLGGTNSVPQDCSLLIIAGPAKEYPAAEIEKIQKYLEGGGRMFLLLNSGQNSQRQIGLEKVLTSWGVRIGNGAVRDPAHSASPQQYDVTVAAFSQHPVSAPLIGSRMNLISPLPVLRNATDSKISEAAQVSVLIASEESAKVAGEPAANAERIPLAVAVEKGNVKGVVTARGTTRMVVVGDSFFLGNGWIKMEFNAEFASHAVNWLLDRSQLLEGIGPRPMKEFRLSLTQSESRTVHWLLLGALPGSVLLVGVLVWLRRRN